MTLHAGDRGIVIVNQTPFYAESGGQVGDRGTLSIAGKARLHRRGHPEEAARPLPP